jgi:hypothetical protein
MGKFMFGELRREVFLRRSGALPGSNLRKVTHLTAQKHAAQGQSELLIALSAFIIAVHPIGTVIAVYPSEKTMKEPLIEYE